MARWHKESDCGMTLLRCENCNGRIIFDHYSKAVGLLGFDYCPYCGTRMERMKDIAERIEWIDGLNCPREVPEEGESNEV